MKKYTIKQKYASKQGKIEWYCKEGMTVKQIARRFDVTYVDMSNIIKALDISVIRLRNQG